MSKDALAGVLDQVTPLADRGWVAMGRLFEPDEIAVLAASAGRPSWTRDPRARRLGVTDPRWNGLIVGHLGPDACFVREQLVTKAPRSAGIVPWHQDQAYSPLTRDFLTIFVALADMAVDDGCLRMRPGSHRHGPVDHVPRGYLLEIAEPGDADGEVVPLAAGEAVAFTSLTHHCSGPNRGDGTRPAWMAQFSPAAQTGSSANQAGASSPATRSRKARTL